MTKLTEKAHLLIVEARFYEKLSDALLDGAMTKLNCAGVSYEIVTVPGALEIPAAIAMAEKGATHFDGYIALGCVIRGETYHFEIVANESCRALTNLAVEGQLAIGNGILTVENEKQAWERAKRDDKDKGGFAATATLAMIALREKFGAKREQ